MRSRPSAFEDFTRRDRRHFRAADGEPQAVAGHRIDEPGGIAREQEARHRPTGSFDSQRAQHDRRRDQACGGEPLGQDRIARQFSPQEHDGVPQGGIASLTAPGAAGPSAALLAGLPAASSPHDGWAAMIPGLFAMKSVKLAIFAVLALAAGAKKIKDALTGGRGAGTGGRAGLARFDQLAKGKSA